MRSLIPLWANPIALILVVGALWILNGISRRVIQSFQFHLFGRNSLDLGFLYGKVFMVAALCAAVVSAAGYLYLAHSIKKRSVKTPATIVGVEAGVRPMGFYRLGTFNQRGTYYAVVKFVDPTGKEAVRRSNKTLLTTSVPEQDVIKAYVGKSLDLYVDRTDSSRFYVKGEVADQGDWFIAALLLAACLFQIPSAARSAYRSLAEAGYGYDEVQYQRHWERARDLKAARTQEERDAIYERYR